MTHDTNSVVDRLMAIRAGFASDSPDPSRIPGLVEGVLRVIFPQLSRGQQFDRSMLVREVEAIGTGIRDLCSPGMSNGVDCDELARGFIGELPQFHELLLEDAQAIFRGDPAATSIDEVIVAYPGFFAIAVYRIAHWLYQQRVAVVPRMIAEHAHRLTGIDIHPGASIGRCFVIDHGTGIVIGETTVIEDNVKVYQGVTLGALSVAKEMANTKRHPTIERDVVIYANATILGGSTVIGAGSIVGGNVWITESVPPGSRVYHNR